MVCAEVTKCKLKMKTKFALGRKEWRWISIQEFKKIVGYTASPLRHEGQGVSQMGNRNVNIRDTEEGRGSTRREGGELKEDFIWDKAPPHCRSQNKAVSGSPGQQAKRPCGGATAMVVRLNPVLDCSSRAAHAGTNREPHRAWS